MCTVAIAYLMQKTTNVFPIIGGRKVEHLMENLEALKISLTAEQIKSIENVLPFDPGFPNVFIVRRQIYTPYALKILNVPQGDGTERPHAQSNVGVEDRWPLRQPIKPSGVN